MPYEADRQIGWEPGARVPFARRAGSVASQRCGATHAGRVTCTRRARAPALSHGGARSPGPHHRSTRRKEKVCSYRVVPRAHELLARSPGKDRRFWHAWPRRRTTLDGLASRGRLDCAQRPEGGEGALIKKCGGGAEGQEGSRGQARAWSRGRRGCSRALWPFPAGEYLNPPPSSPFLEPLSLSFFTHPSRLPLSLIPHPRPLQDSTLTRLAPRPPTPPPREASTMSLSDKAPEGSTHYTGGDVEKNGDYQENQVAGLNTNGERPLQRQLKSRHSESRLGRCLVGRGGGARGLGRGTGAWAPECLLPSLATAYRTQLPIGPRIPHLIDTEHHR